MRILKWTLATTDRQSFQMPKGAQILSVQAQGENAQLWTLCDPSAPPEMRHFAIYGTGNPIDGAPGSYIGTYQIMGGRFVGHVFEVQ